MEPEIHLFIIWEKGRVKEREILDDIKSSFTLLKEYEIVWSPELVSTNYSRFYGQQLPKDSFKEKECGTGAFLLCIVKDNHPQYSVRMTSHGMEEVNINLFDKKTQYREWTGGGHKIHCTTNKKETNHDLVLLLGKNVEDFCIHIDSPNRELLFKDVEGASGWDSISHLFYVLNNTTNYVVLRGHNELFTLCPKEDIDILTDEYDSMYQIINSKCVYFHVRPKAETLVGGTVYYLDIWDAKKDYFDLLWMREMLSSSIFSEGIRVLNEENDFYCRLYHCLINKGQIAPKHRAKLDYYKQRFHIEEEDLSKVLVDWLSEHNYDIIEHKDPSNPFHISDPVISAYALRIGKCIRIVNCSCYDILTGEALRWESRVYEKKDTFVKKGTTWLIGNEKRFLSSLHKEFVPVLLSEGTDQENNWIEISRLEGENMEAFFSKRSNYTMRNLRQVVRLGVQSLWELNKSGIMHRDVTPENVIIGYRNGKLEWKILDFGWSVLYKEDKKIPCPPFLGKQYAPDYMYSDFYSYGMVLLSICRKMPYIKRIANALMTIQWDDYQDIVQVERLVNIVHALARKPFKPRDFYYFYRKKYSSYRKYFEHPNLIINLMLAQINKLFRKVLIIER